MLSTTAPIKERALEFMRFKGLTVYEFAKKIEVSSGVFYGKALQSELSGDETKSGQNTKCNQFDT